MTPEEFSHQKDPLGDLDYYEFAEAYAKQENKALQKQVEELKKLLERASAYIPLKYTLLNKEVNKALKP